MNAFPKAQGDDEGIWRRINPFLFRKQLRRPRDPNAPVEGEADMQLPQRIRDGELPGVLNWLVAGVGDWLSRGLSPPETLRRVLEEYRRSSSPFGDWLNENCVYGDEARNEAGESLMMTSKALLDDFKAWWTDQGHDADKVMSARAFGDALRDRQILSRKDGRGNKIRGPIRLKTLAEKVLAAETEAASATSAGEVMVIAEVEEPGALDVLPEEWEGEQ
jgi:putative DNA primase/helicase